MQKKRIDIGKNIFMDNYCTKDFLEEINERIEGGIKTTVSFLNVHCYNLAHKKRNYLKTLQDVNVLLPDGFGIHLGAKIFGFKLKEELTGTDLLPKLLEQAAKRNHPVFLLGTAQEIAEKAADSLKKKFPGINIVGCHHGYFNEKDNDAVVRKINEANPDILVVGRSVPIQELWIAENKDVLNARVMLAVGAYIDFESGRLTRAPKFFRRLKLEWFFRLVLEPKRMWKRYIVGNVIFFYYIYKNKFKSSSSLKGTG
ncbi:WecB/TagA/CpsF family glycosyltransferase [Bacillus timonensis]|nr:WecB/TagA/CpsF family glycosyltransferase [Bacillus timonensis]